MKRVDIHDLRCYFIYEHHVLRIERGDNKMDTNKIISTNLKALRQANGIKQKFIAEQLGISPNYYSQIENGHRLPQLEHLLILRNHFNVKLDDLFFNTGIANRDNETNK